MYFERKKANSALAIGNLWQSQIPRIWRI